MTRRLAKAEILEALATLPAWRMAATGIEREFHLKSFVDAIGWVNQIAEIAEARQHHPDLDIRYDRVRVFLTTHDAGGITERDIELARAMETLYANGR